jgi:hypothetical protein
MEEVKVESKNIEEIKNIEEVKAESKNIKVSFGTFRISKNKKDGSKTGINIPVQLIVPEYKEPKIYMLKLDNVKCVACEYNNNKSIKFTINKSSDLKHLISIEKLISDTYKHLIKVVSNGNENSIKGLFNTQDITSLFNQNESVKGFVHSNLRNLPLVYSDLSITNSKKVSFSLDTKDIDDAVTIIENEGDDLNIETYGNIPYSCKIKYDGLDYPNYEIYTKHPFMATFNIFLTEIYTNSNGARISNIIPEITINKLPESLTLSDTIRTICYDNDGRRRPIFNKPINLNITDVNNVKVVNVKESMEDFLGKKIDMNCDVADI